MAISLQPLATFTESRAAVVVGGTHHDMQKIFIFENRMDFIRSVTSWPVYL